MSGTDFVGPHGHDYAEVAQCLASFRDETIVFAHNPGNAGDNLINLGTYRLFDRIGLRYEHGTHTEVYPDRVVVYSGGGALVPHYPGSDSFFRRNHPVCKALVLLPHTVRMHGDMIAEMDERCHLFLRETPSYEFVANHVGRAHLYKAHDMAFTLDRSYVSGLRWDLGELRRAGRLGSWASMIAKFVMSARFRDSTLHSLRADSESTKTMTHPLNYDMSRMFATADMRPASCENVAKALSTVLPAFRHIRTDRLHIAIFSAIMGLDVEMRDNNYGKNHDIYEHSMRDRFANVRFVGA